MPKLSLLEVYLLATGERRLFRQFGQFPLPVDVGMDRE